MFNKEKINKFRINIGEVGREGDKFYLEIEYRKVTEDKVKVEYYISYHNCGLIEFVVGYEIDINKTLDIENQVFEEAKSLYYSDYFDSAIACFYKTLDDLEELQ